MNYSAVPCWLGALVQADRQRSSELCAVPLPRRTGLGAPPFSASDVSTLLRALDFIGISACARPGRLSGVT